jgi:hypothetical protein
MCSAPLAAEHSHVVDVRHRSMMCTCRPCYLLFTQEGAGGGRFRAVPDRVLAVSQDVSPAVWDALQVPVGVAFFFFNTERSRVVGFYPSPAGATESELPLDAWDALAGRRPALRSMQPDVEALLVRRRGSTPAANGNDAPAGVDAFIVPIDLCYELVGRIRQAWRGFQGGDDAWRAIDEFFGRVADRARPETAV